MKSVFLATAVVLVSSATATVGAPVKVATYTGVIASGTDASGLFGTAGSSLTGAKFTTIYTYDLKRGRRLTSLPTYDDLDGGTGGTSNPVLAATLTINGVTRAAGLDFYGITLVEPIHVLAEHQVVGDYDQTNFMYNYLYVPGLPSLNANLATTGGTGGGLFRIAHGVGGSVVYDAQGTFSSETLTISGGVPEPASWAMLVAGFAAVGMTTRRRGAITMRRRAAAA